MPLEENPNPASCIIRTLAIADRFKFAIGPRLAKYIAYHRKKISLEKLLDMYLARYASTCMSIEKLNTYFNAIKEQLQVKEKQPIQLPTLSCGNYMQSGLWNFMDKDRIGYLSFLAK